MTPKGLLKGLLRVLIIITENEIPCLSQTKTLLWHVAVGTTAVLRSRLFIYICDALQRT